MEKVRISKKWKAIMQRNDGTAQEIIKAVVNHGEKAASREGLTVTVNGRTYVIQHVPSVYHY
jgi:hypothetical protein